MPGHLQQVSSHELQDLAMLELIRVHRFRPYQARQTTESAAAAVTDLDDQPVDSTEIRIITEIVAIDQNNAPALVSVGAVINGTFNVFESLASPGAGVSTRFSGQLILKDSDFIRGRFADPTAGDNLRLNISGYSIHK